MTIKQSTIDDIQNSLQFLVSFERYGSHATAQTKISITYYTKEHAFTVEAWATITPVKYRQLTGYDTLMTTLKPHNYTATRINKATGEDTTNGNQISCKAVFELLCDTISHLTGKVYLDQYQTIKNKNQY